MGGREEGKLTGKVSVSIKTLILSILFIDILKSYNGFPFHWRVISNFFSFFYFFYCSISSDFRIQKNFNFLPKPLFPMYKRRVRGGTNIMSVLAKNYVMLCMWCSPDHIFCVWGKEGDGKKIKKRNKIRNHPPMKGKSIIFLAWN